MSVKHWVQSITGLREINTDFHLTGEGRWNEQAGYLFIVSHGHGLGLDDQTRQQACQLATRTICQTYYDCFSGEHLAALEQAYLQANTQISAQDEHATFISMVTAVIHHDVLYLATLATSTLICVGTIIWRNSLSLSLF